MISPTCIIYDNVKLGADTTIEDFCIIGALPKNCGAKVPETVIGGGAVIRAGTVIYAGNRIGKNFQTGNKANIRESNTIGDDVSIGTLAVVEHHVIIERGVRIHSQAFVPEYSHLKEGSWVGPHAVLTNAKFPLTAETKDNLRGPILERGARIGANATVLPGIVVGENALVGAGSVVVRDVGRGTVVAGNPAKIIGGQ